MKIKIIVTYLIFCILVLLSGYVYAEIDTILTIDCVDKANSGDEINFTLKLNVNSAEQGINGLVGEITYPIDVLTMLTPESSEVFIMDGYLLAAFDEPITSGEKSISLKFIVKNNVTVEDVTIGLSNVIVTDADDLSSKELNNVEKKILINKSEPSVPAEKKLTSIEITNPPQKTTYKENEYFDKTGMELTAKYSDGSSKVVSNYTFSPSDKLEETDTEIIISYTEDNITKNVVQNIIVIKNQTDSSEDNKDNSTEDDNKDFGNSDSSEDNKDNSIEDDNKDFGNSDSSENNNDVYFGENDLNIESNTDNTVSKNPHPNLGLEKNIFYLLIILIIVLLSYNGYKKYKNI